MLDKTLEFARLLIALTAGENLQSVAQAKGLAYGEVVCTLADALATCDQADVVEKLAAESEKVYPAVVHDETKLSTWRRVGQEGI